MTIKEIDEKLQITATFLVSGTEEFFSNLSQYKKKTMKSSPSFNFLFQFQLLIFTKSLLQYRSYSPLISKVLLLYLEKWKIENGQTLSKICKNTGFHWPIFFRILVYFMQWKAYSEHCQSSEMEHFANLVNDFQMLLIIVNIIKDEGNKMLREVNKVWCDCRCSTGLNW